MFSTIIDVNKEMNHFSIHSLQINNKFESSNRILEFKELTNNLSVLNLDVSQKENLIDSFLLDQEAYGFPIVYESKLFYIYRGSAVSAFIAGDFNDWDENDDSYIFVNISNTTLFYLEKEYEKDARFEYLFIIDSNWILDPLNNRTVNARSNTRHNEVVMPDYFDDGSYLFNVNFGGTLHSLQIRSNTQDGWMRTIQIYLPPNYDPNGTTRYKTFYTQDGSAYVSLTSAKNVLDYLIFNNLTEPLIGIFVDPIRLEWRGKEYGSTDCTVELDKWYNPGKKGLCYEKYTEFIATELVPYIDSKYLTINQSEFRGIIGASLGGFPSIYLVSQYPEVFKLIGTHSGSFWPGRALYRAYEYVPKIEGLRFYLTCGTYGLDKGLLDDNIEFAEILEEKGYPGKIRIFHAGHSWGQWRTNIGEMLIFLFTNETSDYTGSPHFSLPGTATFSSSTISTYSYASLIIITSDITTNTIQNTSKTSNASFYLGLIGMLFVVLLRRKIKIK
ncbi:MAG: alpha/beta hydrolase-fold protein [Candidatus Hodarchaeales archaeon]